MMINKKELIDLNSIQEPVKPEAVIKYINERYDLEYVDTTSPINCESITLVPEYDYYNYPSIYNPSFQKQYIDAMPFDSQSTGHHYICSECEKREMYIIDKKNKNIKMRLPNHQNLSKTFKKIKGVKNGWLFLYVDHKSIVLLNDGTIKVNLVAVRVCTYFDSVWSRGHPCRVIKDVQLQLSGNKEYNISDDSKLKIVRKLNECSP